MVSNIIFCCLIACLETSGFFPSIMTLTPLAYVEVLQNMQEIRMHYKHIILGILRISDIKMLEHVRTNNFGTWKLGFLKLRNFESDLLKFENFKIVKLRVWDFAILKFWNYEIRNFETSELWNFETIIYNRIIFN